MNDKIYNLIMNSCIAIAVVSALLFDKAGNLEWLVSASGIAAAVVATVFYFYNLWVGHNITATEQETVTKSSALYSAASFVQVDSDIEMINAQLANSILDVAASTLVSRQKAVLGTVHGDLFRKYLTRTKFAQYQQTPPEVDALIRIFEKKADFYSTATKLSDVENIRSFEVVIDRETDGNVSIRFMTPRVSRKEQSKERLLEGAMGKGTSIPARALLN